MGVNLYQGRRSNILYFAALEVPKFMVQLQEDFDIVRNGVFCYVRGSILRVKRLFIVR
jgi:hypothetical protein